MAAPIVTRIRSHPIVAFYVLAFVISWSGWIPRTAHSHGLLPFDSPLFYLLGGAGPMIAASIVLHVVRGKHAVGDLFAPLLRWRIPLRWYVVALLAYPVIWIAALAVSGDLVPGLRALAPLAPLATTLPTLLILLVAAIPEELAWRGFALPRLQARHSALVASLVVGALWALWHLPLLMTQGSSMASYPLVPYLLEVTALSVVYTWVFNSTAGSVLVVALFHAASNLVGPFVGVEQTAIVLLVAGVIVALLGPSRLSTQRRIVVHDAARTGTMPSREEAGG